MVKTESTPLLNDEPGYPKRDQKDKSSSCPGCEASIFCRNQSIKIDDEQDGRYDEKLQKICGFIPVTNTVKSFFVMMSMNAFMTIAQLSFAIYAHSKSLLADDVTMAVDTFCYVGNILGESSSVPRTKATLQLVFSLISIFLLVSFNTYFFIGVLGIFSPDNESPADEDSGDGVSAWVVLTLASFGLLFDLICLNSCYINAKKDAEAKYEVKKTEAVEIGEAKLEKPKVNMLSALLHIGADLMRSITTFSEGIILLFIDLTPSMQTKVDSIATFIICIVVYACSAYALRDWIFEFRNHRVIG